MQNGWLVPWNVAVICEKFKTSLSNEKTPHERRFGEPFSGPIISFGSMIEYHPSSAKKPSRLHQFGKKVLPGIFLGYMYCMRAVSGKDTSWLQRLRSWKFWTRQKFVLGDSMRKRSSCRKMVKISFSRSQMKHSSCLDKMRFPEDPSQSRITLARGEEHNDDLQGEPDGSQPSDTLADASEARNDLRTTTGSFICRHHLEPRIKLHVPKEESFPIPLRYIDVVRWTNTTLDVLLESRIDDNLNVDGGRPRFIGTLDWFHAVHNIV